VRGRHGGAELASGTVVFLVMIEMVAGPFEDLAAIELQERRIDAAVGRHGDSLVDYHIQTGRELGALVVGTLRLLGALLRPLTVKRGQDVMQPAAAAGVIRFQDEVAERLEFQHGLEEKLKRAGGVRFPLAGAPQMLRPKTLCETDGDGGAREQAFVRAKRLAAGAGVDGADAGINGVAECLSVGTRENAG
jgi:hypothetical protein